MDSRLLEVRRTVGDIGVPELLILLAIIIILFGPSRLSSVGKALGDAISGFRRGLRDGDAAQPSSEEQHS